MADSSTVNKNWEEGLSRVEQRVTSMKHQTGRKKSEMMWCVVRCGSESQSRRAKEALSYLALSLLILISRYISFAVVNLPPSYDYVTRNLSIFEYFGLVNTIAASADH